MAHSPKTLEEFSLSQLLVACANGIAHSVFEVYGDNLERLKGGTAARRTPQYMKLVPVIDHTRDCFMASGAIERGEAQTAAFERLDRIELLIHPIEALTELGSAAPPFCIEAMCSVLSMMAGGCRKVQKALRQHCGALVPFLGMQLGPTRPDWTQKDAAVVLKLVLPQRGPPLDAEHLRMVIIAAAASLQRHATGFWVVPLGSSGLSGDVGDCVCGLLDTLGDLVVCVCEKTVRTLLPTLHDYAWPALRELLLKGSSQERVALCPSASTAMRYAATAIQKWLRTSHILAAAGILGRKDFDKHVFEALRSVDAWHASATEDVSKLLDVVQMSRAERDALFAELRRSASEAVREDPIFIGSSKCGWRDCSVVEERAGEFKVCGRCRRERYCSQDCQRKAWKTHKSACQRAKMTAEFAPPSA